MYIVFGRGSDISDTWYGCTNGVFQPFSAEDGPMESSRFRNILQTFPSLDDANAFISRFKLRNTEGVKDFCAIPISEELHDALQNKERERELIVNKLNSEIDPILDQFDFAAVEKAMKALNMRYGGEKDSSTVSSLKERARRLLEAVVQEDNCALKNNYQVGGLKAWRNGDGLELSFEISAAKSQPFFVRLNPQYRDARPFQR